MLGIALISFLPAFLPSTCSCGPIPSNPAPSARAPSARAQSPQSAPPGMVLVKGGKTKIGSNVKDIKDLVLAREERRGVLIGETPQHTVKVEDFYLMPTEVTNEQYAKFVKATSAKPPRSWGIKALQAGQAEFLQVQGKAKQEARKAGKPFTTKVFDPETWWEANWDGLEWEIPQTELAHPVVFVTYGEAQDYARWAGLRLMTEVEFQRAARGNTTRLYPWGDEWDDSKYCQSLMIGKDASAEVGSYPAGAVDGLFDLAGNVWEWTSSPYTSFDGYKTTSFKVKKRKIDCLAPWDPNQRVIVSGSFQMDPIGVRLTTRMNTDRTQSTNALGFRCAATPGAGLDASRWIIQNDLRLTFLGSEVELAPELTTTLRYWESSPGTSKIPGYSIITSYEHILSTPTAKLRASSPKDLASRTTKDGPIFVGFIDVPRPLLKPELDAGSYMIFWRGAGKLRLPEEGKQGMVLGPQDDDEIPFHEIMGFDAEKDNYFFYTRDGVAQIAIEAPPLKIEKINDGMARIAIELFVPPDPKSLPKDAPPPVPIDTLRFTLVVPSATSRSKGLVFDLPILVRSGSYDPGVWK